MDTGKGYSKIVDLHGNVIVGITRIGGYYNRRKKEWFPERIMIATRDAIYEHVPVEMTVPINEVQLPQRKLPKKKKAPK